MDQMEGERIQRCDLTSVLRTKVQRRQKPLYSENLDLYLAQVCGRNEWVEGWMKYLKEREDILGHQKNIPKKLTLIILKHVIPDLRIYFFDLLTRGAII